DVPPSYEGLVPFSMFIAIPTFEPGVWMAHNLASAAGLIGGGVYAGLGGLTKALGLGAFRAAAQIGATQWDSHALYVHARLGALELLTAWTPAHGEAWTLTYRALCGERALLSLAGDPSVELSRAAPDLWIEGRD